MLAFGFSSSLLAAFLAFVAFTILVASINWRSKTVQERINLRLAPILEFQRTGIPPFRARFVRLSNADWIDTAKIERLSKELQGRGFFENGDYIIKPVGTLYKVHYHPTLGIIGLVAEGEHPLRVWVTLLTVYEDGTEFSHSGAKFDGLLDQPPFRSLVEVHENDVSKLIDNFVVERPAKSVASFSADEFPAWVEDNFRREMDWRIERGGLTEDEIQRAAQAQGGQASVDLIATIRERWRLAIEQFQSESLVAKPDDCSQIESLDTTSDRTTGFQLATVFRFTIREWVLVTIVVGLALTWALDHWNVVVREKQRAAQVQELIDRLRNEVVNGRIPSKDSSN